MSEVTRDSAEFELKLLDSHPESKCSATVLRTYIAQLEQRVKVLSGLLGEAYGSLDGAENDADLCQRIKAALAPAQEGVKG
jgi:hypothetical protein